MFKNLLSNAHRFISQLKKGQNESSKQQKLEENYRKLEEDYETLKKQIKEEVAMSRQKDHMLIQGSRLAAMGEMIASIGHQWREPLNHLSLLIQDVSEANEFGEMDDQYIDRFTTESMVQIKHMSQTINDFRKFYMPNKEKNVFSIGESIEDTLSIFSSSIKTYNISVQFEYRGEQMAYGYQNEFSQAVLNILTNARDIFVERSIKNRHLEINICSNGSFYTVKFTDNAGGVESELLPHLFEPYYTTRQQGTGLGLYMSKMILEKMNGKIEVENVDQGVKFILYVPKAGEISIAPSVSV